MILCTVLHYISVYIPLHEDAPAKTEALCYLLIQQAGLSLSAPTLVLQHTDDAAKKIHSAKKKAQTIVSEQSLKTAPSLQIL